MDFFPKTLYAVWSRFLQIGSVVSLILVGVAAFWLAQCKICGNLPEKFGMEGIVLTGLVSSMIFLAGIFGGGWLREYIEARNTDSYALDWVKRGQYFLFFAAGFIAILVAPRLGIPLVVQWDYILLFAGSCLTGVFHIIGGAAIVFLISFLAGEQF